MYPLEKYTYVTHTRKDGVKEVVAISTYAGKIVRGIAKCDPTDEYNAGLGMELAAARCNAKIAKKRKNAALKAHREAVIALNEAKARLADMENYVTDSQCKESEAKDYLNSLLAEI
jgi:hypothetical protein